MKVQELIKILRDYDIEVTVHFATNKYTEEIDNIDIWTVEFFEKEV